MPLWRKTEEELATRWACRRPIGRSPGRAARRWRAMCWTIPSSCAGKRVLDFGAGSGIVALAAARAGASHVLAADIDKFAIAAIAANAAANGLTVATTADDIIGSTEQFGVILVGDMCYERPLAERLMAWLKSARRRHFAGRSRPQLFPQSRASPGWHFILSPPRANWKTAKFAKPACGSSNNRRASFAPWVRRACSRTSVRSARRSCPSAKIQRALFEFSALANPVCSATVSELT